MALQQSPHPRRYIPRRSSAGQSHEAYAFPSPIGGIDGSKPLPGGNPQTAILLDNLIPRNRGCVLRRGHRRWVSNLSGEVRTLMEYHPAAGEPSAPPKLFAAVATGAIYDVSALSGQHSIPDSCADGGPRPWRCPTWALDIVQLRDEHRRRRHGALLVMVGLGGGYWTYDGTAWAQHTAGVGVGQIDGVDPMTFSFAMVYKTQLVFLQKGTTTLWSLPSGQIAGIATPFDLGSLLPNGGALVAAVNWTFDGSAAGGTGAAGGMDNKLVLISDQGDVLVYSTGDEGLDGAGVSLQGRWFVGRVPVGHRFFSQYAADVAIISERGLSFMTELMRGEGFFTQAQAAARINSDLASQVTETLDVYSWEVKFLSHEQLLVIKLPEYRGRLDLQWAFEVNNRAFCMLRGYYMMTIEAFNGHSFGGDAVGNVWALFEGDSDGEVDGVPGKDLQGAVVTSFQSLGEGVRVKRFLMVKPSFIASTPPSMQVRLNSEWNLLAPSVFSAVPATLRFLLGHRPVGRGEVGRGLLVL